MWKSNANDNFHIPCGLSECQTTRYSEEFPDCAITYHHVSTKPAVRAAKHHRQNACLTAMFGHYIGGYFTNLMQLQSQISLLRVDNNTNTRYPVEAPLGVFAPALIRPCTHSSWHTFEATFAGSLPYSPTTHRCMFWKAPGKQSQI